MIRTQIYLPKSLLEQLRKEATEQDISLSELIRQKLVEDGSFPNQVNETKVKYFAKNLTLGEKMQAVANMSKNQNIPSDLAMNHDKYLYGNEE